FILTRLRRKKIREAAVATAAVAILLAAFMEPEGLRRIRSDDFNNMAVAWNEKGDAEKANIYLERALVDYPLDAPTHFNKGQYYFGKKKWEQAIRYFEKALELKSEMPQPKERLIDALFLLAKQRMDEGDCRRARVYLQRILRDQPDSVGTLLNLGVCYARLGQDNRARALFQRALQIDPENGPAKINLERLGPNVK
ncbi:MAG: tetratricopeptide repeat protein, partial [Nitrospinales bacterium]